MSTVNQVYNTLNRITGAHLDPVYAEPRPGEQRRSSISATKIKAELGLHEIPFLPALFEKLLIV